MELTTKEDLVNELRSLLQSDKLDKSSIKEAHALKSAYETLDSQQKAEEKKKYLEEGGDRLYFEYSKDPMDAKWNEAWNLFYEAKTQFEEARKMELQTNKSLKEELIAQLQDLTNEENIGKAFNKFNVIREKWNEIGDVSKDVYHDLEEQFSKLIDQFYYQIRIYKELQEHDLKKHYEEKKELIEKMGKLLEEKRIKDVELWARAYQTQWNQIGPTFQDKWEEVRDEFREISSKVYQKIKSHYQDLKEKYNSQLEEKAKLIEKAKQGLRTDFPQTAKNWEKKTEIAQKFMEEWKAIGSVPKSKSDEIWTEFKSILDSFYEEKSKFFEKLKTQRQSIKEKKLEIIKEAEALKESELWKQTSAKIIQLQKQWKKLGAANPRDEQKLWLQFREICDHFFARKKDYYANIDTLYDNNLKAKKDLLALINDYKLSGDKALDLSKLKEFMTTWNEIGHVSKEEVDKIQKEYKKLIDEKFAGLDLKKNEKIKVQFETKIEQINNAENTSQLFQRENRQLSEEIKKIEAELLNYENNMAFFKFAKDDNPLKMQAQAKIDVLKEKLNTLQLKKNLLNNRVKQ